MNLHDNKIGDDGMVRLAEAIATDPVVATLILCVIIIECMRERDSRRERERERETAGERGRERESQ